MGREIFFVISKVTQNLASTKCQFLSHVWYILFFSQCLFANENKDYVIGHLEGQPGNNFFQIATTSALAWDNGVEPFFPQLGSLPTLYNHFFSRCKIMPPSPAISSIWIEPFFRYHPIFYQPQLQLKGYFQSWRYFDYYRDRLIALFAPSSRDMAYIKKKYSHLINQPNTVAVQIRYYVEDPYTYAQYGRDYFEKAMSLFSDDSLFVVSSNRIEFAKQEVPTEGRNVIFLENEPPYIDFHILTMCSHSIITNSTFGWWCAYLNRNIHQRVVCPLYWSAHDCADMCPASWIKIGAKRLDPSLVK